MKHYFLRIFALFSLLATPVFALDGPAKVTLIPEYSKLPKTANSVRLTVEINLKPGWHTYAKDPGSVGYPLKIHWIPTENTSFSELEFPVNPEQIGKPPLVSYGYHGSPQFLTTLYFHKPLRPGPLVISGVAKFLVCKESCVPMSATLNATILVTETETAATSSKTPPSYKPQQDPQNSLLFYFLTALLGGFILNLMPCVLPVITLKLFHLINLSQKSKRVLILNSLCFSLGILSTFWALAFLLFALQKSGVALGWGFQLQSPVFVAVMASLFLLLSFNLWGFFEIGSSLTRLGESNFTGYFGAFTKGVFTTIVATPCSAPFVGAAIGGALTTGIWGNWIIFTGLGLGLCSPYLLFALFPRAVRFLPKPGVWMSKLKKLLGFAMLASSIWMFWILATLTLPHLTKIQSAHSGWRPYSQQTVLKLQQNHTPFLIDFTADWCLTCKLNEALVLSDKTVQKEFKKRNIQLLKADWTAQNPEITQALASYGRNSVPLYVLDLGNGQKPLILPELLNKKSFLTTLRKVKPDETRR